MTILLHQLITSTSGSLSNTLPNMKKYLSIIVLILLGSCKSYHRDKFDYINGPNAWINSFKDQMYYECIKEGYQNDTLMRMIRKVDLLNPYDDIDFEDIDYARSLGRKIIENMPKPYHCEDCKGHENYVSSNCLHYYASRELDSIAQSAYKKHLKNRKKTWGKDY